MKTETFRLNFVVMVFCYTEIAVECLFMIVIDSSKSPSSSHAHAADDDDLVGRHRRERSTHVTRARLPELTFELSILLNRFHRSRAGRMMAERERGGNNNERNLMKQHVVSSRNYMRASAGKKRSTKCSRDFR